MDIVFSLLTGLILRLFLSNVDGAFFLGQFALTIIAKAGTDNYLAFALRIVVDLLCTASFYRALVTLAWTGVGVVVAEIFCAIPSARKTRRVRRRSISSTVRTSISSTFPTTPWSDDYSFIQPQDDAIPFISDQQSLVKDSYIQEEKNSTSDCPVLINSNPSSLTSKQLSLPSSGAVLATMLPLHNDTAKEIKPPASEGLVKPRAPPINAAKTFLRPRQPPTSPLPTSTPSIPSKSTLRDSTITGIEVEDENDLYFPFSDPLLKHAPLDDTRSASTGPMIPSDSDELRTPVLGNLDLSDTDELKTPDNIQRELSPLFFDNGALPTFTSAIETLPTQEGFP